jgi:hypothetical protein
MTPPISVTVTMLRKCTRVNGVSRASKTSRRRSLSATSAARETRLSVTPVAIAASVRIEHGAMIMPSVLKEPLAMLAPMSFSP